MSQQEKIDALRKDLELEVTAINPQVGDIILVKPKSNDIHLSDHYKAWVAQVIQSIRPQNQILILDTNDLSIETEKSN